MAKKEKKKDQKRVDMDVRPFPNPIFDNYDLYGPSEGGEVSPGTGLYNGRMADKPKSVKEFIDKARKRRHSAHSRKKALMYIVELIARGEAGGKET
ncbi:hypothetical protein LCGC14_0389990 [marine sediment metagenome]|uniref:Uncharacterized protein n=1 Tax=marine sediment metagenome TaxID=412755 RepID=A0A0F9THU3_9ZZZZ